MRTLVFLAISSLIAPFGCADDPYKAAKDPSAESTTSSALESAARQPDAVYVEPPAAIPDAHETHAAASMVTLREPADPERVRAVAAQFFDALSRDDDHALATLLTDDALALDSRAAKVPLLRSLKQRLRQHDFSKLAGLEAARPSDIVTYERRAPSMAAATGSSAPDPHDSDVAVRVPMENPRPAGEPLFNDTVYLLLREEHGTLRISGEGEDVVP